MEQTHHAKQKQSVTKKYKFIKQERQRRNIGS